MSYWRQASEYNNKLEIIQEGLQLKLDMQNAKEEFLGILEGYHNYENYDQFEQMFYEEDPAHRHNGIEWHSMQPEERVPPLAHTYAGPRAITSSQKPQEFYEEQFSDPRARVKALYEARKCRMHARRDRLDNPASTTSIAARNNSPSHWHGEPSYPHTHHTNNQDGHLYPQRPQTPVISLCSESDKENYFDVEDRNNNTPTKSSPQDKNSGYNQYNSPDQTSSNSSNSDPPYINMLSTINEENSSSSKNSSGNQASCSLSSDTDIPKIPPRCPLIPKDRYKDYLSGKTPPKPNLQEFGEYVTLKIPNESMVSFSEMNDSFTGPSAPSMLQQPSIISQFEYGSMFSVLGSQSNIKLHRRDLTKELDTSRDSSGFRYAKSDVISEMYTSQKRDGRSALDISCISNMSSSSNPSVMRGTGVMEGSSSINSDYPLHSTMIGSQIHSPVPPVSLSETDEDSLMNRTDDTLDTFDGDFSKGPQDTRTTISEPSAILRGPNTTRISVSTPPKAYDDCYLDSQKKRDTSKLMKTPRNPIPCQGRQRAKQGQNKLCSEHGLHLNYGGACLFEDSFDLLNIFSDSDIDFSSVNFDNSEAGSKLGSKRSSMASKISSNRDSIYSKFSSKRSSVIHNNSAVDTDCDSSYLSECVDDPHFTNDFSEAENYTALYDARNARMKFMRRQTGQGDIKRHKQPVALSESDLLHDVTERHLSLQATRTSEPDIYNLSPPSSSSLESEYDVRSNHHDSTLKSVLNESDDDTSLSHNQTIISCDQRPVSLCTSTTGTTTTDESPESNGGMTVPVNSPNRTDSGGSSSRPTTDTYDYVDVPINIPRVAQLLKDKLVTQHNHPPTHSRSMQSLSSNHGSHGNPGNHGYYQSRKHHPHQQYAATSSAESQRSQRSKQSQAYSDPTIPQHQAQDNQHKPRRSQQRYPRSQDSGFATHESGLSRNKQPPPSRSHSYDPLHDHRTLAHSCYVHSGHQGSPHNLGHIAISDPQGITRNVIQHSAVARNLNKDRKKALARKLKNFSNNFYYSGGENTGIKTLGHF